jgi:hypothetical protein
LCDRLEDGHVRRRWSGQMCSEPSRLSRSRDGGKRSMKQDSVVQSDVARRASMMGRYRHCMMDERRCRCQMQAWGRVVGCPARRAQAVAEADVTWGRGNTVASMPEGAIHSTQASPSPHASGLLDFWTAGRGGCGESAVTGGVAVAEMDGSSTQVPTRRT